MMQIFQSRISRGSSRHDLTGLVKKEPSSLCHYYFRRRQSIKSSTQSSFHTLLPRYHDPQRPTRPRIRLPISPFIEKSFHFRPSMHQRAKVTVFLHRNGAGLKTQMTGEGGKTVVVGVKLDSHSKELLTWALVKVAEPGDHVIAIHVLDTVSGLLSQFSSLFCD